MLVVVIARHWCRHHSGVNRRGGIHRALGMGMHAHVTHACVTHALCLCYACMSDACMLYACMCYACLSYACVTCLCVVTCLIACCRNLSVNPAINVSVEYPFSAPPWTSQFSCHSFVTLIQIWPAPNPAFNSDLHLIVTCTQADLHPIVTYTQ